MAFNNRIENNIAQGEILTGDQLATIGDTSYVSVGIRGTNFNGTYQDYAINITELAKVMDSLDPVNQNLKSVLATGNTTDGEKIIFTNASKLQMVLGTALDLDDVTITIDGGTMAMTGFNITKTNVNELLNPGSYIADATSNIAMGFPNPNTFNILTQNTLNALGYAEGLGTYIGNASNSSLAFLDSSSLISGDKSYLFPNYSAGTLAIREFQNYIMVDRSFGDDAKAAATGGNQDDVAFRTLSAALNHALTYNFNTIIVKPGLYTGFYTIPAIANLNIYCLPGVRLQSGGFTSGFTNAVFGLYGYAQLTNWRLSMTETGTSNITIQVESHIQTSTSSSYRNSFFNFGNDFANISYTAKLVQWTSYGAFGKFMELRGNVNVSLNIQTVDMHTSTFLFMRATPGPPSPSPWANFAGSLSVNIDYAVTRNRASFAYDGIFISQQFDEVSNLCKVKLKIGMYEYIGGEVVGPDQVLAHNAGSFTIYDSNINAGYKNGLMVTAGGNIANPPISTIDILVTDCNFYSKRLAFGFGRNVDRRNLFTDCTFVSEGLAQLDGNAFYGAAVAIGRTAGADAINSNNDGIAYFNNCTFRADNIAAQAVVIFDSGGTGYGANWSGYFSDCEFYNANLAGYSAVVNYGIYAPFTLWGGALTSSITNPGAGLPVSSFFPNTPAVGGTGTNLTYDITTDGLGQILTAVINNPGEYYTVGDTFTFPSIPGSGTELVTLNTAVLSRDIGFKDVTANVAIAGQAKQAYSSGLTIEPVLQVTRIAKFN